MQALLRATSIALVLLCAFAGRPAAAADADLKITVTNGDDTAGDVRVQVRPAGQHNGDVIAEGGSGDDIKVPAGTYDVDVTYVDGAANKIDLVRRLGSIRPGRKDGRYGHARGRAEGRDHQ